MTLRVPEETVATLETMAQLDGISLAEEIRRAMAGWSEALLSPSYVERLARQLSGQQKFLEKLLQAQSAAKQTATGDHQAVATAGY